MVVLDPRDVERKVLAILRIVAASPQAVGARRIAAVLAEQGILLTERAVRYHLQLMDERGLTLQVGREGRVITERGRREAASALVADKVGYVIGRINQLAFQTTFDPAAGEGNVVMNTALFRQDAFSAALEAMRPAFRAGLATSDRVALASPGERLGTLTVPAGLVGFSTVCSVTVNGVLLKAGIPMDSRFGGILELAGRRALRFVELIHYSGSSLDPSEAFIRARMTDVLSAVHDGYGRLLANFRELPAMCRSLAQDTIAALQQAGIGGIVELGEISEPICQVPVDVNVCGLVLLGGLNPVAAAAEAGHPAEYRAMSTIMPWSALRSVWDL